MLQDIDGRRRLFQQKLDRRVGDNRHAVRRLQKVVHILRDGGEAEIIFASALGQAQQERSRIFGFHHPPRLVDDQQAFFQIFSHGVPDIVRDDIHGDRLEFVFHVAQGKDDEFFVDVHVVGWLMNPAHVPLVYLESRCASESPPSMPASTSSKSDRSGGSMFVEIAVGRDVLEGVGFGDGAVDDGVFFRRQPAEHDAEKSDQVDDVGTQHIGADSSSPGIGKVKRIDVVLGIKRNVEISSAGRFGQDIRIPSPGQ